MALAVLAMPYRDQVNRAKRSNMKPYKSPEILRLSRIEKWAKARFEQRMKGKDVAAAMRAANFYTAISCRADGAALQSVTPFR
jgi:hypothetical protein